MIMTVSELRQFIDTEETDQALEIMLQALELSIRAYTNNNFQDRAYRRDADIVGGLFIVEALTPFAIGDTIQITQSDLMPDCLCTVATVDDSTFTVIEDVADENDVLVTRVSYPADIKLGVVNLMKWELNNRAKVGVASETISRHSVTYFDMGADNSIMGYPRALLGFLKPYKRARFGKGINV